MARTFHRKNRLSAVTEINVTPLIDLAFALLIIFMITTPLLEQTIPLDLPTESENPAATPVTDRMDIRNLSIDLNGQYFWGDEPVDEFELRVKIAEIAKIQDPPVVHVRAAGTVMYQEVVNVLDMLKQEKLSKISLDTHVK